jgi:hypothetical protein
MGAEGHLEGKRREGVVRVAIEGHRDDKNLKPYFVNGFELTKAGVGIRQTGPSQTRSMDARGRGRRA